MISTRSASQSNPAVTSPNLLAPILSETIEPYAEGGVVTGARLIQLPAIGGNRSQGFKRGDIIRLVEGRPVNSLESVREIPKWLQQQAQSLIEIERDGKRFEITYYSGL